MKSNFQIIVLGVFIGFAVLGVILFSTYRGAGTSGEQIGSVVIWGTVDREAFDVFLGEARQGRTDLAGVRYEEKDPGSYSEELTEAIASGRGPDLFILPQDLIVSRAGVIQPISYDRMSARAFRDTFVQEGELYLIPDGILGVPLSVDPLILYYNRNILSTVGIASVPKYWDEFFVVAPKIVVRDRAGNITRSAVSLGEFRNVTHAKDILATLILQAASVGATGGNVFPMAGISADTAAVEAAVRYYTEFSNPVKTVYSWNRALKNSRAAFTAGELAFYIGYASELSGIRAANPNLDFDIAPVPQSRDRRAALAHGRMSALSIARGAQNPVGAALAALALADASTVGHFVAATRTVPARRDLLTARPDNPYSGILYDAALASRGWFDPNPAESTLVFSSLVETVTSGRGGISDAVRTAAEELSALMDARTEE